MLVFSKRVLVKRSSAVVAETCNASIRNPSTAKSGASASRMVVGAFALAAQSVLHAVGVVARDGRSMIGRVPDTVRGVRDRLGLSCNCAEIPSSEPYR